jgi:protein phosphatase PTC7
MVLSGTLVVGASTVSMLQRMVSAESAAGISSSARSRSSSNSSKLTGDMRLKFEPEVAVIPHPEKVSSGGEDRNYISAGILAVFDGVGGWAGKVNPADYPTALTKGLADYLSRQPTNRNSLEILQNAWQAARKVRGSSTACLVTLHDGRLDLLNVGDSGMLVVRNSQIVYRTVEQQHYFNCPYQLGESTDLPEHGHRQEIPVEQGDLVILGTDGLFDNVFDADLLREITKHRTAHNSWKGLANHLANYANKISLNPNDHTPFAHNAGKNGLLYNGGKSDDITVVVAEVVDDPPKS